MAGGTIDHVVDEELRARTLDTLYQGVVVTDAARPDDPVVYVNDAFLALTGYARDEVLGRNCRFLQGEGTDPEVVLQIRDAIADGRTFFGELLNYRKDGTAFWNALSLTPLHDRNGRVTHFIASQTDVTELKRLEEHTRTRRRMELLGTFAGGIAHDFNNVLQAAGGLAELLEARLEDGDLKLRAYAHEIVRACSRGRGLAQQLLAFSRSEESALQPVPVDEAVHGVSRMIAELLPPGVTLERRTARDAAWILGTTSELEQVVLNLVVNARDAVGESGTIVVATATSADVVTLTVTDDGIGMPPETRERIFEPLFTTKPSGTGMGLATVAEVVARFGGRIAVDSAPGRGARFTARFLRVDPPEHHGGLR